MQSRSSKRGRDNSVDESSNQKRSRIVTDLDESSIIDAMGVGARPIIFVHKINKANRGARKILINALCPPSGATVDNEHNNKSSEEIFRIIQNYNFYWNDLFPWSPSDNSLVRQDKLMKLVQQGNKSPIIVRYENQFLERMQDFVREENIV